MTMPSAEGHCASGASRRALHGAVCTAASGWDATAGWWSARTLGWPALAKLRIRFERQLDTHLALLKLACAFICLRFVERFC